MRPFKAARISTLVASLALTAASTAFASGTADVVAPAQTTPIRIAQRLPTATIVQLDETFRSALRATNGRKLVPGFPLRDDHSVDLILERFRVTLPDTRFVVGRPDAPDRVLPFDPEEVVLLRGRVAGVPGSHVYLALSDHGHQGYVQLGGAGERFMIGSRAPGRRLLPPDQFAVFEARAGGRFLPPDVPYCGVDIASADAPPPPPISMPDGPVRGLRQLELAVETDYEYYVLFNDLDAAAAYVVQMYGAVSDIYIRDVNTYVALTFVRLWDDPDDLFNEPNPLFALRDYWNANMGHVPRDAAQLFSGRRNLPAGGIAWLSSLCGPNGYSWVGYALGYFNDPEVPSPWTRDVIIAAHELAHNCAALHTHDYGLDTCHLEQSQPQRGTIMSYCGQTFTGGDANVDMRFHRVVQNVMRPFIATRDCIIRDCNANGVADEIDIAVGTSLDVNGNGIPDECEDCNGNGILDDIDILTGTSLDLNNNGIPDECEPDCNDNGVPDDLDIVLEYSQDLNGNGIPDECEADCNGDGVLDYAQIIADMSLDLNRNAVLDSCEDCSGDGVPDLVALDHAHNVWVAALDRTSIREYLALAGTLYGVSDNAGLNQPQDLIITPDRRVLVSSGANSRVVEFTVGGQFVGNLVPSGTGGLSFPAAMLLRTGGRLLVASRNTATVLEYDVDTGAPLGAFVPAGSGGLVQPFGLALHANGNLLVTSNDGRVLEYDGASGAFVRVFVSNLDNGGLTDPRGMLVLPKTGNLLVASRGTNRILEYDGASGAFVRQFSQVGTSTVMTFDQPWCIRLGPDGGVYASRAHDHDRLRSGDQPGLHLTNARIYHFDAETGYFVRAYVMGVDSGIQHPTGFDFVADAGTDCNNNQIPDECDIASGRSADVNSNGVPDECECLADLNGDGHVDLADLSLLLSAYGCGIGDACYTPAADIDDSGGVGLTDLSILLAAFGTDCP